MKETVISTHNLSIGYPKASYKEEKILYTSMELELFSGELTCLLGPNGAGKSTLLRTLSAMQKPMDGKISLFGKKLEGYSETELSYLLGLVLTDETSVGGFTVSQLVGLGRYPYTGFFGKLSGKDHSLIEKAMSDVGIIHKAENYMAELSDGEKQKAMIAKALAQECPVILLDEPTAYLDIVSRIEIMNLLHSLAYTQNKAILLSTHDIELALMLADRLWLLSRQNGLKSGITEDILLSDAMEVFLARNDISFDKYSGNFVPVQNYQRFAYVQGNESLLKWMKNFLRRNYWDITEDIRKADFSIYIDSPEKIIIDKGASKYYISSFALLNEWLRKHFFVDMSK